jgi:Skp family chaperone for outer membrane proteins
VQKVIEEIAKDKGISVVFERQESALLYVDSALDLTDEVIERLKAGGGSE